jgi:hypothetical protein
MISQSNLISRLNYNKDTGVFTKKSGSVAGWPDRFGYLRIEIKGKAYYAHRLAWLYEYGEMPKHQIDHITGNKSDNRICNLRQANRSQNLCNVTKTKRNTSGIKNVSFVSNCNKWRVRISRDRKDVFDKLFDDIELAELVAIEARKKYHGEFARN